MRVGAVDCGTNSLRLLVADVSRPEGTGAPPVEPPVEVTRRMEIVRLGQAVDAQGRIAPEAMRRAFAVVEDYARICRELGCERTTFAATSAARDAANVADFFDGVRAAGFEPEVITGEQEAELSFLGATSALTAGSGNATQGADLGRTVVVDLGGGSTEFVAGRVDAASAIPEAGVSVDLGAVRLTERLLHGDPPGGESVAAAAAETDARLDEAEQAVPLQGVDTLVGVAGTVTTLTAHALRLDTYDRDRIHGVQVPVGEMLAACEHLLHMPAEQRAALPYLHPGRVDVIGAGALIWSRIVRRVVAGNPRVVLRVSESDILDGLALGLA